MLGAAAITFSTTFFGFFSSRRRLVRLFAMIFILYSAASDGQRGDPIGLFGKDQSGGGIPDHVVLILWGQKKFLWSAAVKGVQNGVAYRKPNCYTQFAFVVMLVSHPDRSGR